MRTAVKSMFMENISNTVYILITQEIMTELMIDLSHSHKKILNESCRSIEKSLRNPPVPFQNVCSS